MRANDPAYYLLATIIHQQRVSCACLRSHSYNSRRKTVLFSVVLFFFPLFFCWVMSQFIVILVPEILFLCTSSWVYQFWGVALTKECLSIVNSTGSTGFGTDLLTTQTQTQTRQTQTTLRLRLRLTLRLTLTLGLRLRLRFRRGLDIYQCARAFPNLELIFSFWP